MPQTNLTLAFVRDDCVAIKWKDQKQKCNSYT